jgi:hypothetical protein
MARFGNQGNSGGSMFQRASGGGSMFTNAQPPLSLGAHLDDGATQSPPPRNAPAPTATVRAPETIVMTPAPIKVTNPLDTLATTGVSFSAVGGRPVWSFNEGAKDDRIVVAQRIDHKTQDQRFQIVDIEAIHQQILNDPMDVLKDFFEIVPKSTLGDTFMVNIQYNHLDVVDVPQDDFLRVQELCREAYNDNQGKSLYTRIMDVLDTMQAGPYRAMLAYLKDHVNRALYLSCRLAERTDKFLSIDVLGDLSDLLDPTYQGTFAMVPGGKQRLETIVTNALWNALARNVSPLFGDGEINTHALQSSPAMPFSIPGVYPNKYAIPTADDSMAGDFKTRLKEKVLSKSTYLLSRRSVMITNVLGDSVLDRMGDMPGKFESASGKFLKGYAIPYARHIDNPGTPVKPFVSEEYPGTQLEAYYDSAKDFSEALSAKASSTRRPADPLDQTIFALKYGTSPKTYLAALDVFSVIDDKLGQEEVLLARKPIVSMKTTV